MMAESFGDARMVTIHEAKTSHTQLKLEGDGLSKEKEVSKSALLEWGKYDR